jgi:signal peptidase II
MLEILHPRRLFFWYLIAFFILILDQFTKQLITGSFNYGDVQDITAYFNLVRVHNYGAAFSFLSEAGGWQRWALSSVAGIVSIGIIIWISRVPDNKHFERLALALILGGALGNLIDRMMLGYVVDFLDFHWSGMHFPAFNVADSCITLGAILLITDGLFSDDPLSDQINEG